MEARTASELLRTVAGGADAAFGATSNTLPPEDADVRARAMPAPPLGGPEFDGWRVVDLVPARELVANNFKVLGIDHRLHERFAKVQSVILQWVLEAERQCRGRAEGGDLSALNTALRWERLAPAIFLRPPRRGNGSIAVGGRIDRFLAGDYEVLVAEYLRDLLRNHRRQVHFVDIQGSANAGRK